MHIQKNTVALPVYLLCKLNQNLNLCFPWIPSVKKKIETIICQFEVFLKNND